MPDSDLERLLRAAANAPEPQAEGPFGFDTRVVATWRSLRGNTNGFTRELTLLLRRIAVGAALLTLLATAGAYWQVSENEEAGEPLGNSFAIADSAIETGLFQ